MIVPADGGILTTREGSGIQISSKSVGQKDTTSTKVEKNPGKNGCHIETLTEATTIVFFNLYTLQVKNERHNPTKEATSMNGGGVVPKSITEATNITSNNF